MPRMGTTLLNAIADRSPARSRDVRALLVANETSAPVVLVVTRTLTFLARSAMRDVLGPRTPVGVKPAEARRNGRDARPFGH